MLSQVGGLGDVVTSLSRAVQDLGHNVEVILPKHDCLNLSSVSGSALLLLFCDKCSGFIARTEVDISLLRASKATVYVCAYSQFDHSYSSCCSFCLCGMLWSRQYVA
jgi:glycogen synthase